MADPQSSDATATQNFIDWFIDPLSRAVTVDPAFGAMPLHLKKDDDFDWRIHFLPKTGTPLELSSFSELAFVMLEKGRYDGTAMAQGTVANPAWDSGNSCYHLPISLNGQALAAFLATLDATTTGFSTGGFDCSTAEAKAAGTSTTTVTNNGNTTATTAPATPTPSALTDYEFMAEFRWVQNGQKMRSQTFSIFIARDLITTAAAGGSIAPPTTQPPVDWRFITPFVSEGTPYGNELFGYFLATNSVEILGLQIALQQPDPASGMRIQLTDADGNVLGGGTSYYADLPANTAYLNFLFGSTLTLNSGQDIRAIILNYAGQTAVGLTVNLLCRQFINTQPSGPSGPPGLTAAVAVTLAPGSQATATVNGQTVTFGIPQGIQGNATNGTNGTMITQVVVNMLAAGSNPTAALSGASSTTLLTLGIPYPADSTPPNRRFFSAALASQVVTPTAPVATSVAFTGRGLPAIIKFGFTFQDNVTTAADMNLLFFWIYRSDSGSPIFADSRYMTPGAEMYLAGSTWDDQTSTEAVTYTLQIIGYARNNAGSIGSYQPRPGTAGAPYLKVLELGNPLQ